MLVAFGSAANNSNNNNVVDDVEVNDKGFYTIQFL
jgi:hypothetical protein